MKNKFTRIKVIFIVAAVVLLSLSTYAYIKISNLMQTSAWINHTATVKLNLEMYFSSVRGMESAMRGYLISKSDFYIKEFEESNLKADAVMLQLKANVQDNYSQRENFKQLQSIYRERLTNMKTILRLQDYSVISDKDRGMYRLNRKKLRDQVDKMLNEEDMLLRIRKKSLIKESSLTPFFAIFLTFASILVLIVTYYAIYQQLKTANRLRADLEEKNESLEKMNKELESFTYISSHDLQEPLRKIQTFISILIDKETAHLSEKAKNYLQRSQDSARRMQNLIRDLLAYSRLNAEVFPSQQIDLSELIADIREDFDEEIDTLNVRIEVLGNTKARVIVAQFRQVLINLISNAIKFAKTDEPAHMVLENSTVPGTNVPFDTANPDIMYNKLVFSDNGIGFDNQYKDRIFKVFQRLHIETEYKGTGIGLAIVKKIIDNHSGFITADSVPGNGAVFTMYLPA